MKKGIKRVLVVVLAAFVLGVALFVWALFRSLRTFGIEDQIHGTFFPACVAIERFTETNGVPPRTLEQLTPSFLPCIPTSPYVHKLDYTPTERGNWIMNAHSRTLRPARFYSWRSDGTLSDEENAKLLKQFHNVSVIKE